MLKDQNNLDSEIKDTLSILNIDETSFNKTVELKESIKRIKKSYFYRKLKRCANYKNHVCCRYYTKTRSAFFMTGIFSFVAPFFFLFKIFYGF